MVKDEAGAAQGRSARAIKNSRSGGLHACTTSIGPSRLTLIANRNVCHSARVYSRRKPSGPPAAGRNGNRSMRTPSITVSRSRSCFAPVGQITVTWCPAPTSARLSCHTRRSTAPKSSRQGSGHEAASP